VSEKVGIGYNEYCCTPALSKAGQCDTPNELVLVNTGTANWTASINGTDAYQTDANDDIFYWSKFPVYSKDRQTAFANDTIVLPHSGVWYFLLLHCSTVPAFNISVTGQVIFTNPHGHLSGIVFPFLPLYFILSLAYIGLGAWIGYLAFKYRETLMGLQMLLLVVLAVGMNECLVWLISFIVSNSNGLYSTFVIVVGTICTIAKLSVVRLLVLLVVIGYSITMPTLERRHKLFLGAVMGMYIIAASINEYVNINQSFDMDVPLIWEIVGDSLLVFLDSFIFVYIAATLWQQMRVLRAANQTAKLAMYRVLALFLLGFCVVAFIAIVIQFAMDSQNARDRYWNVVWLFEGVWEVGYFLAVLVIAIVWRPNENNERYAYAMQLNTDETALQETGDNSVKLQDDDDDDEGENGDEKTMIKNEVKKEGEEVEVDLDD